MRVSVARLVVIAVVTVVIVLAAVWLFVPRAKQVEVIVAAEAPAERVLAVNGRIRPRLQVDVRSPLGGEIVALPFDVGDRVDQGQILARIDDAPEIAAIAQAEASVQAQAASVAQARRDLARFEALGEFVSKRELEQKRLAVEEGERELSRRRASVVQARELRDRRVLRAPFAGVIMERPVDPGQTVSPETVIYRLADLAQPEITAEVDEIYAAEIRPGMQALIRMPGLRQTLRASVVHVEPRVDPATGASNVRLQLRENLPEMPAGLTVSVNLVIERRERAISLPRSAIMPSQDGGTVRVIGEDGRVGDRAITYLNWPSQDVIVATGISPGDVVLTDPLAADAGDQVEAKKASP